MLDRPEDIESDQRKLVLVILNRSPFAAQRITATVDLGNGCAPVKPASLTHLGPDAAETLDLHAAPVGSQVIALVKQQGFMTWEHSVVLEYSDPNGLLRWRQRFPFHSGANGPQDNPAPVTNPDMPNAPELVGFSAAVERTPGWWEVMRGRPDSSTTS